MPINRGHDKDGYYLKWGLNGKQYYFNPRDKKSYNRAYDKVIKQSKAIFYNKSKKNI